MALIYKWGLIGACFLVKQSALTRKREASNETTSQSLASLVKIATHNNTLCILPLLLEGMLELLVEGQNGVELKKYYIFYLHNDEKRKEKCNNKDL